MINLPMRTEEQFLFPTTTTYLMPPRRPPRFRGQAAPTGA